MKILVFTTQFHKPNGAELQSLELAVSLNEIPGTEAHILSMYSKDTPGVASASKQWNKKGIKVIHHLNGVPRSMYKTIVGNVFTLRKLLNEHQYDIIETSLYGPTLLANIATWGHKTKHVIGIHDVYEANRQKGLKYFLFRLTIKLSPSTQFYAITNFVAKKWAKYIGTTIKNVPTISNSIPNEFYSTKSSEINIRNELNIDQNTHIALFVGRLQMRKGLHILIDAIGPILLRRNIHLLIVGNEHPSENIFEGEEEFLNVLKMNISTYGWSERITFLGRRQDIPDLMRSSSILVHPALIEGFGRVLLEAMAVGLPIITTRVDGIPEVIKGSGTTLVNAGDIQALRTAIEETLIRDKDETSLIINMGKDRASHFNSDKRAMRLLELFQNHIAGK